MGSTTASGRVNLSELISPLSSSRICAPNLHNGPIPRKREYEPGLSPGDAEWLERRKGVILTSFPLFGAELTRLPSLHPEQPTHTEEVTLADKDVGITAQQQISKERLKMKFRTLVMLSKFFPKAELPPELGLVHSGSSPPMTPSSEVDDFGLAVTQTIWPGIVQMDIEG